MSFAHFKQAQAKEYGGFAHALEEMEQGHKQSHWIWYIFPQIAGLGRSPMAQTYALADADDAMAYLHDPELRERLLTITRVVAAQIERGMPLGILMGAMSRGVEAIGGDVVVPCYLGSLRRPMNRMLPVLSSRIKKRKG